MQYYFTKVAVVYHLCLELQSWTWRFQFWKLDLTLNLLTTLVFMKYIKHYDRHSEMARPWFLHAYLKRFFMQLLSLELFTHHKTVYCQNSKPQLEQESLLWSHAPQNCIFHLVFILFSLQCSCHAVSMINLQGSHTWPHFRHKFPDIVLSLFSLTLRIIRFFNESFLQHNIVLPSYLKQKYTWILNWIDVEHMRGF